MTQPVRATPDATWFRPSDGGAGALLRVADGVPEEAVRRIRDAGVGGLLPIGNVVVRDGGVWLRTPQPPGPMLVDLLTGTDLDSSDAVAVLGGVARVVRALHARGLHHGRIAGDAVLLDPAGAPLLVMVRPGPADPARDAHHLAALARVLAGTWCDADGAALLHRFAEEVVRGGLDVALPVLPRAAAPGPVRRALADRWS
ncbi:hypothetical protein [Pseudonocardia abyssalis]|uniref:Protein kinase domain-containing protein n=1 Tax=Pseudonocardia abyssalis TaxID=2792008 RepID=A0ABS6UTQ6_9PSEU|nr:hypothetical protein [Pseudonocardia abyssalis]MBW0118489.1 hypothetical protein [Pseudonocardia abyssalis]MBW0135238.1 hypothetical protein [Pseudonocardia abyssalis]